MFDTMWCFNCGSAIPQPSPGATINSEYVMMCPFCGSGQGRTSVSPEEFAKDFARRGKGYLEKAGMLAPEDAEEKRRHELVDKYLDHTITKEELRELKILQPEL